MTVAPQDSPMLSRLFSDPEIARLFTDTAVVRAMLIVEGTLAKVQGDIGMIPSGAAEYLHRASMEVQIDPAGLAEETAKNGVCVPALVAAFRKDAQAPEFTQYLHWGATSQDIIDTGLALRLRQVLTRFADRLDALLDVLAGLARNHAETPMAARTYGQIATPTTFGAMAAGWGEAFLSLRAGLQDLRDEVLIVTLAGASGTLSVMGDDGPRVRQAMAQALGLRDPGYSPHATRGAMLSLVAWSENVLRACDKIAADLLVRTRDGTLALGGGGASSTMPQKANPVGPSVVRALVAHGGGHATALRALAPLDQRDGAAWFTEWLSLPPLLTATGRALAILAEAGIAPNSARMLEELSDPSDLIHAEALTFHLARDMPRPEAQAQVKAWAATVKTDGGSLLDMAGVDSDAFRPQAQWGEAPALARRFADRVDDARS